MRNRYCVPRIPRIPYCVPRISTVYTNPLSKGGSGQGHYGGNPETYMDIGEAMGRAMAELLKK